MPTYVYRCRDCGHEVDIMHGVDMKLSVQCARCDAGGMYRVFTPNGNFILKGKGFYSKDNTKGDHRNANTKIN